MAFSGDGSSVSWGPFGGVILIMIGLVVVVALAQFIPTLGGSIEQSQPSFGADSDWNSTHNADLPSGAGMYAQNFQLVGLLATIIIVSIILAMLVRL